LGAHEASSQSDKSRFETFAGEHKLNPILLRRWMAELETRAGKPDPIFGPWFQATQLKDFAGNANSALAKLADESALNSSVRELVKTTRAESLKDFAQAYSKLFKQVDTDWKNSLATA